MSTGQGKVGGSGSRVGEGLTLPWVFKPGIAWVLLRSFWVVAAVLGATALSLVVMGWFGAWRPSPRWWVSVLVFVLLVFAWQSVVWACERYTLDRDRAVWESGVFRRLRVEVPLQRVQNVVLYRSLGERLLGLGTVGIACAGTDGYEVVWRSVERSARVLAAARGAIDAAAGRAANDASAMGDTPPIRARSIPVIGLSGGVGSGKSTIGRLLAEMGCLVIDSDQRSREALDRPEVKSQLVRWWGGGVLGADGRVDRARVAAIVFADAAERARLEALVHPIVRQDRSAMIAEAEKGGGGGKFRAVVIDAPLLFEAGLDAECDAVIFVDAPREERLRRVAESRGWDEAELDRREAAQMPLDQKRARSGFVVENASELSDLRPAVEVVLGRIALTNDR